MLSTTRQLGNKSADLDELADTINTGHQACEQAVRTGIDHAIRVGEAMFAAKSQIIRGGWLGWLKRHCPTISERQAQGYMRIAKHRETLESNPKPVSPLGIKAALAILAEPRPASRLENPRVGPLPDPCHKLLGVLPEGRVIELISAANPEFVFYAIHNIEQTAEFPNGYTDFGKRPVCRRVVHEIVNIMARKSGSDDFSPDDVHWGEQQPCEAPADYFPDYVPDWKQPGWAENRKREIDKATAEGRLEEFYLHEAAVELGEAGSC